MHKYSQRLDNTVGKLRSTTDPNHFRVGRELRNDEKNGTEQVK